MSGFDANETVNALLNGISKLGETLRVIRDPIQAGDKLIIPAVVARMGVGAGGGSGHRPGERDDARAATGSGGGGGGGLILTPVFLVVDAAGERLITVPNTLGATSGIIDALARAFSRPQDGGSGGADAS